MLTIISKYFKFDFGVSNSYFASWAVPFPDNEIFCLLTIYVYVFLLTLPSVIVSVGSFVSAMNTV